MSLGKITLIKGQPHSYSVDSNEVVYELSLKIDGVEYYLEFYYNPVRLLNKKEHFWIDTDSILKCVDSEDGYFEEFTFNAADLEELRNELERSYKVTMRERWGEAR